MFPPQSSQKAPFSSRVYLGIRAGSFSTTARGRSGAALLREVPLQAAQPNPLPWSPTEPTQPWPFSCGCMATNSQVRGSSSSITHWLCCKTELTPHTDTNSISREETIHYDLFIFVVDWQMLIKKGRPSHFKPNTIKNTLERILWPASL